MKKQKPLWRISVATSPEAEDAVGELLASAFGQAAACYYDLEKQTSLVSVFIEQGKFSPVGARREIAAGLKRIAGFGLNIGAGKIEIAKVKREDWAESWKRHFHPMEIGKTLLVKPSWSKKRPAKNQAVVILDPGLSFGTGQHPTTSFCLNEIARCRKIGTRHNHFWTLAPARAFWQLPRPSWATSRFTLLILTRNPSAWQRKTCEKTAWPTE